VVPRFPSGRQFDGIFDAYRGEIPVEYMRALAMKESGMRPDAQSGPAWGLMQIVEVVRRDYNRAHQTSYTRADLLDPSVNVAMAAWLLRTIITSYARRHPDVPNLQANWDNLRFVELLTFSWNGGWSEAGGVGRVARYLKSRGELNITIDLVHQSARAAGASIHLSRPEKVRWCKSVARLYERERRAGVSKS
jgi:soluble lytic murein transglycosylase-like protein